MTVREFLQENLEALGVYAAGETMSAADASRGLSVLNGMIKSWNNQGLLIHKRDREEFALVAGQSSRTVGATGNFVTTKPNKIIGLGVEVGNTEYICQIISTDEYQNITDKSTQGRPEKVWIQGTHPNETLHFYPVPSDTNNLVIYSLKPISSALALADTLSMPDGYEWALGYNFRVAIAPFFNKQVDALTLQEAQESKANIMRQNQEEVIMASDLALMGRSFDFIKGDY